MAIDGGGRGPAGVGRHAGLVPLGIGSVVAVGCGWLAARGLLGAFRPELVGASFSSDISQPDPFLVQASVVAGLLALAGGLLLVGLGARGTPAARRVVSALTGGALLLLGARAVLAAPDSRCAFDRYAGQVDACTSGQAALAADVLMVAVPGGVAIAGLWVGGRRRGAWPAASEDGADRPGRPVAPGR